MRLGGLALRADGGNKVPSMRLDCWTGKDQIRPRNSEAQARPWGTEGLSGKKGQGWEEISHF